MAESATAFGNRHASHAITLDSVWRPGEDVGERDTEWTRRFFAALGGFREGVYVNFLGSDEVPGRVREAYGDVYERLADVKRRTTLRTSSTTTRTSALGEPAQGTRRIPAVRIQCPDLDAKCHVDGMTDSALRNISDTARWVAVYRALESERPDACFHDPLAARLAGERGREIARTMDFAHKNAWSFVARTVLFDRFILSGVKQGADMVVNLAAGLDTRPYRMDLPADLPWIEVDLPELLHDKTLALAGETPRCRLERVALDLSDRAARRALFDTLGARARHVLVMSEGLIVYLNRDEVTTLAEDLLRPASFTAWALDMVSPRLLRMMESSTDQKSLTQVGAPLKFAPVEGPDFFSSLGWRPVEVSSLLHTAATLKRLTFRMRLMALLPDPAGKQPNAPWGGVCVFTRRRDRRE